ncbi:unnamed protein product, partial [Rotaria sp. Silwood1]
MQGLSEAKQDENVTRKIPDSSSTKPGTTQSETTTSHTKKESGFRFPTLRFVDAAMHKSRGTLGVDEVEPEKADVSEEKSQTTSPKPIPFR